MKTKPILRFVPALKLVHVHPRALKVFAQVYPPDQKLAAHYRDLALRTTTAFPLEVAYAVTQGGSDALALIGPVEACRLLREAARVKPDVVFPVLVLGEETQVNIEQAVLSLFEVRTRGNVAAKQVPVRTVPGYVAAARSSGIELDLNAVCTQWNVVDRTRQRVMAKLAQDAAQATRERAPGRAQA